MRAVTSGDISLNRSMQGRTSSAALQSHERGIIGRSRGWFGCGTHSSNASATCRGGMGWPSPSAAVNASDSSGAAAHSTTSPAAHLMAQPSRAYSRKSRKCL